MSPRNVPLCIQLASNAVHALLLTSSTDPPARMFCGWLRTNCSTCLLCACLCNTVGQLRVLEVRPWQVGRQCLQSWDA